MFKDMDKWVEIRRKVLTGELSKRGACAKYRLPWRPLVRILEHEEPIGYQLQKPRPKRKLEKFLPIIHEILQQDRQAPKKQRHTAQRIFDRLQQEHRYDGGLTIVKEAVRAWKQREAEVFVPLAHRPGEALVDFGQVEVKLGGEPVKVAMFVMTLTYWGKEHTEFNPIHYLALLERKPGAFDHARPLEKWELPDCFGLLRRRQEAELEKHGTREFIKVLRLLEHATLPELTGAVEYALSIGANSADAVKLILQSRREEPVSLFCLEGVRPRQAGSVLEGNRAGHPSDRSPRRAAACADEGPTGQAGPAGPRRVGLRSHKQAGGRAAVRRHQHGLRADQSDRDHQPAV